MSYSQFSSFLGSVFVPACALLQPNVGLRAYIPTMVPQNNKPAAVPDQTALMFWATPDSHNLANKAIAVRIYQNLHGEVYDMARSKTPEVPVALSTASGKLQAEQPYYLFEQPADWMLGSVNHLVGARRTDLSPDNFLTAAYAWAANFAKQPSTGVDAALICCGNEYVVAWVHSKQKKADLSKVFDELAALTSPVLRADPEPYKLPAGLWEDWDGIDLTNDACINIQFDRPSKTVPRKFKKKLIPIEHFEAPHLALWKSCVTEVLSKASGQTRGGGIEMDHPLIRATDRYCRAMLRNSQPQAPDKDSDDEEAVLAYLSYLHHMGAHARIANDTALEKAIAAQTAEYKFGNPLWQQMLEQYFIYYWQYPFHKGGKPQYRSWQAPDAGNGDLQYGVIDWRLPSKCRVAIVGDIGTGTDVAAAVLVAALKFNPDAILHLGDTYYSGTAFEMKHRLVDLVNDVMKSERCKVPFFTVPGNHEYFTGAIPYLKALDSNELVVEPSQRQKSSYFCLRTADDGWQFLGLDTGYHGHYMNVTPAAQQAALKILHQGKVEQASAGSDPHWPANRNPYFQHADSNGNLPIKNTTANEQVIVRADEVLWHQDKMRNFPGRSILMSHHQLYSALNTCGLTQKQVQDAKGKLVPDPTDFNRAWINTGLWRQFGPYFGDKVPLWIWGHEHNLVIFKDNYRPDDWPKTSEASEVFKTLPKGRCAGHSAIPVEDSEAPYKKVYPMPVKQPEKNLDITKGWYNHGFQILEISGAGKPVRLSYFQISEAEPIPLPIFVEQLS